MVYFFAILLSISFFLAITFGIDRIFAPNYKIIFDRAKFEDKLDSIEKIYKLYSDFEKSEKKEHQSILNAKVHSYLGTDRYDYRLIFKIIEGKFSNIERTAKRIDNTWLFLDIDYINHSVKISHKLNLVKVRKFRDYLFGIYTLLSLFLIILFLFQDYFGRSVIICLTVSVLIMSFCVWAGSKFSTILSIEKILEPNSTIANKN